MVQHSFGTIQHTKMPMNLPSLSLSSRIALRVFTFYDRKLFDAWLCRCSMSFACVKETHKWIALETMTWDKAKSVDWLAVECGLFMTHARLCP